MLKIEIASFCLAFRILDKGSVCLLFKSLLKALPVSLTSSLSLELQISHM